MASHDEKRAPTLRRMLLTLLLVATVPSTILWAYWLKYAADNPLVVEPEATLQTSVVLELAPRSDPFDVECLDAAALERTIAAETRKEFPEFAELLETWNEDSLTVEIARGGAPAVVILASFRVFSSRRVFLWREWSTVSLDDVDQRVAARVSKANDSLRRFVESVVRDEVEKMWAAAVRRERASTQE